MTDRWRASRRSSTAIRDSIATPLRYATEMKMGLARQWLAQDRLAIDTVADRLGYTSQAAFSRAFKRVTGQSPGASRRAQAEAASIY